MSGQVQKNASKSSQSSAPSQTKPKDLSAKGEELKDKADEISDEIDSILEDVIGEGTAQSFIDGFIQRGGQ